ncbi:MAG: hypothetical protein WB870_03295 [Gallionellaceae bacterium]
MSDESSADVLERFYIRDALVLRESGSRSIIRCHLRGLVLKVWGREEYRFASIRDVTATVQLFFRKQNLPSVWQVVEKLRALTPVMIIGDLAETSEKKTAVFVKSVVILGNPITENRENVEWLSENLLTAQFFMARLRRRATDFFYKNNYEEFEPRYISPDLGQQFPGIDPLRVEYTGFGLFEILSTSPIPQLLEACLVAGREKVFGISRCFSSANRDGYTSAETLVLCAVALNTDFDLLLHEAEAAVRFILDDPSTLPDSSREHLQKAGWLRVNLSLLGPPQTYQQPAIEICNVPTSGGTTSKLFRILYPPGVSLAEGHAEEAETLTISRLTIHLERMVRLIRDIRLGDLRPTSRVRS